MKKTAIYLIFLLSSLSLSAQAAAVFGVKLGANAAREATLSFQTNGAASDFKVEVEGANCVEIQKACAQNFFIAKYSVGPLSASKEYKFKISDSHGNSLKEGSLKTKPDFHDRTPPPDFSFAALGQNYDNEKEFDPPFQTPGGEYEIYDAIALKKPDFAIWLHGASVLRPADCDSQSGIAARYAHAFSVPEIQNMLSSFPNYAVFGMKSIEASGGIFAKKSDASRVFRAFWQNPCYEIKGLNTYSFTHVDTQFFVLDDCGARESLDYRAAKPRRLGQTQMKWLMNSLADSTAKFKIVVMTSPAMNPVESPDNFTSSPLERKELLDFMLSQKIGGVVFISAGKTYGEVSRLVRAGGYPLIDVSVPALTARPADESSKEMNFFRIPNSGTFKRAFCIFKIEGPENSRNIKISFHNSKGDEIFTTSIAQKELYSFE